MNKNKNKILSKNLVVVRNGKNKRRVNLSKNSQIQVIPYKAPVSINYAIKPKTMKVTGKSTSKGIVVTVRHCELIKDITTPNQYGGGFVLSKVSVQPGLKACFPWLSNLSRSFESYQFNSVRYIYKPAVATSLNGTVIMTAQYDIESTDPENHKDMVQIQGTKESSPYKILSFDLSRGKGGISNQKTYKIRNGPVNGDLELYDSANFYIAFDGITNSSFAAVANLNIGELWVEYVVDMVVPVGKTSVNQIANIESLSGTSSFINPTSRLFLGTKMASNFVGKLASAGLSYIEDAVNGSYNLFTNKNINKALRFIQTYSSGTPNTPMVQLLSWKQSGLVLDEDNGISNDEILDPTNLVTLAQAGSNLVQITTAITLSAFSKLDSSNRGVTKTDFVSNGTQIITNFWVRAVAGDAIQFYGLGTGVPSAANWFYMTDHDLSQNFLINSEILGDQSGD